MVRWRGRVLDQHFLLAAEPAADARLDHADALDRQAQHRRQDAPGVERHLRRGADDQPVVLVPVGDDDVRLEADLLHLGHEVLAFENVVRVGEALVDVADVDEDVRGQVAPRVGLGEVDDTPARRG